MNLRKQTLLYIDSKCDEKKKTFFMEKFECLSEKSVQTLIFISKAKTNLFERERSLYMIKD